MSERPAPIAPEPIEPEHVVFMLVGVALTIGLVYISLP
jgi:hypothetical protein